MHRSVTIVLSCLCILGTLAATAPAAAPTTWVPNGPAGVSATPQTPGGLTESADVAGASRTATQGLMFLRASEHPAWIVDVMRELIPWQMGGRSTASTMAAARPVIWVSRGEGAATDTSARTEKTRGAEFVGAYSRQRTDGRDVEIVRKVSRWDDGSGIDLVEACVDYDRLIREYDRAGAPIREPQDDRADDRYYDAR